MSDCFVDVHELHVKFGHSAAVSEMGAERLKALLEFRLRFLREELSEIEVAETPEDLVDGLVDLWVVAVGTLDLFGVDAGEAWRRVHAANLAKESGVKDGRPNPLGLPDLVKPEGWEPPDHAGNVGRFAEIFALK